MKLAQNKPKKVAQFGPKSLDKTNYPQGLGVGKRARTVIIKESFKF